LSVVSSPTLRPSSSPVAIGSVASLARGARLAASLADDTLWDEVVKAIESEAEAEPEREQVRALLVMRGSSARPFLDSRLSPASVPAIQVQADWIARVQPEALRPRLPALVAGQRAKSVQPIGVNHADSRWSRIGSRAAGRRILGRHGRPVVCHLPTSQREDHQPPVNLRTMPVQHRTANENGKQQQADDRPQDDRCRAELGRSAIPNLLPRIADVAWPTFAFPRANVR
jgi:hypothetical protein